jgi:hypothetical protein
MVQRYQLLKVESDKFMGGWKWCETYICVFVVIFPHCFLFIGYGQLLLCFFMAIVSCCICVRHMFCSVAFLAQML